jgi:hypothetical protein
LEIIEIISRCSPKAKISINTNAFPFKRMKNVIVNCLNVRNDLRFSIALDGIGKRHEVHSRSKGRLQRCYENRHTLR